MKQPSQSDGEGKKRSLPPLLDDETNPSSADAEPKLDAQAELADDEAGVPELKDKPESASAMPELGDAELTLDDDELAAPAARSADKHAPQPVTQDLEDDDPALGTSNAADDAEIEEPEGGTFDLDDDAEEATQRKPGTALPTQMLPDEDDESTDGLGSSAQELSLDADDDESEPAPAGRNMALEAALASDQDDDKSQGQGGGGKGKGKGGERPSNEMTLEQRAGQTRPTGPVAVITYRLRRHWRLITLAILGGLGYYLYTMGQLVREQVAEIENYVAFHSDLQQVNFEQPWLSSELPETLKVNGVMMVPVADNETLELELTGSYDATTRTLQLAGERTATTDAKTVSREVNMTVPTRLMRYVLTGNLAKVRQRARQAPEEIATVDVVTPEEGATERALTPFTAAIVRDQPDMVRAMIDAGADQTAKDARGRMPLHIALQVREPNPEIIRMLLESGAPVNAVYGITSPLDLARQRPNRGELVPLLEARGATSNLDATVLGD